MSNRFTRNYNIELLRIVAVFSIVFYHYVLTMTTPTGETTLYAEAFAQFAMISFFAISGFGLFLYFEREKPTYLQFIKHRFSRLIPHYYLCLVIVLLTSGTAYISSWGYKYILSYFLFVQNLSLTAQSAINGALWTVALMAQFYLVAPFVYKGIKKHPAITTLSLVLFSIICRLLFDNLVTLKDLEPIYYVVSNIRQLPTTIDIFTIGMFAAYLCNSSSLKPINEKVKRINPIIAVTIFFGLWLLIVIIFKHMLQSNNGLWEPAYSPMLWICSWETLLGVCVMFILIYLFNININFNSLQGKATNCLSSISMLVYYYHMPIKENLMQSEFIIYLLGNTPPLIPILLVAIIVTGFALILKRMTTK